MAAKTLSDWLTTAEVAEYYNASPRLVLRMIREGRLKAEKRGWVWFVHKAWLPREWPPPVRDSK